MIKKKANSTLFIVIIAIFSIKSMQVMAADSDGCWSGRHSQGSCLEYSTYMKDNKTYFELHNVCDERLYVRWCADKKCGVDGLRGGQSKTKYEYVTYASERVRAIGSNTPSKDWVCAGKYDGFSQF